jgi:hypothetical protein
MQAICLRRAFAASTLALIGGVLLPGCESLTRGALFYPTHHDNLVAESIGSGPAATLGALEVPPDKFVFIVPSNDLKSVARDHVSFVPVGLLLAGSWNNVESLANYRGPMDVFGASSDQVIHARHAQAPAASRPQAQFLLLQGGHNDWSAQPDLLVRNARP